MLHMVSSLEWPDLAINRGCIRVTKGPRTECLNPADHVAKGGLPDEIFCCCICYQTSAFHCDRSSIKPGEKDYVRGNIIGAISARPQPARKSSQGELPGSHENGQVPKYLRARKLELAELHAAKQVRLVNMQQLIQHIVNPQDCMFL